MGSAVQRHRWPASGGRRRPSCRRSVPADIYDAAEQAEQRIGFPANVTLANPARWAAASDALIQQIRSAPVVWVVGPPEDGAT